MTVNTPGGICIKDGNAEKSLILTVKYGGLSVMISVCLSSKGFGNLVKTHSINYKMNCNWIVGQDRVPKLISNCTKVVSSVTAGMLEDLKRSCFKES